VSRAQAQSLEDRHAVDYISPLSGFGRHAVDRLVETFDVQQGPSEEVPKADYEDELRTLIADEHGEETVVSEVFPDHNQTYVHGRND